ncbi:MAG TPA: response regulator [Thermoleophilia bacterium]|nr:response regulator [Thermoleophilia bacterium]HQG54432.1 response regulator [Thermoleophilia bacterium]HQJ98427.1 response regulator [Thermoleophilia bacterium]
MKRVYVVDDDPSIVESIAMVLESKGYVVGSQSDGKDVVDNVVAFGADLVILDVMLPEDSGAGFKMARALKDDERTRDLPRIMLTAVNESGIYVGKFSDKDRDDAWLPVQAFIEKPVDPEVLLDKVERLCPD